MSEDREGRDLLFGMSAVQLGLLSKEQFQKAVTEWVKSGAERSNGHSLRSAIIRGGWLSEESARGIEHVVDAQLMLNDGDPSLCVRNMPSPSSMLRFFGDFETPSILRVIGDSQRGPLSDFDLPWELGPASRFVVKRHHAQGGLGEILIAEDKELGRQVALKRILDSKQSSEEAQARFLLEAEVTGMLEHPGVVAVYGMGKTREGFPYYAMQFVDGQNLKEAINEMHASKSFDPEGVEFRRMVSRLVEICNTIEYAFSKGVVHRDLKPANIVLGAHGETFVLDWGLAKILGRPDLAMGGGENNGRNRNSGSTSGSSYFDTLDGTMIGTPGYMSPEQTHETSVNIDGRSDVYGLGGILYTVLTGKVCVSTKNKDWLECIRSGEFQPPTHLNPLAPKALGSVCMKAMATDPDDRYQAAKELGRELEEWLADGVPSAHLPHETRGEKLLRAVKKYRRRLLAVTMTALGISFVSIIAWSVIASRNLEIAGKNREIAGKNQDLNVAVEEASRLGGELLRSAENVLANFPGQVSQRIKVAGAAESGFAKLHDILPDNKHVKRQYAISRHYRGNLMRRVGEYKEAEKCFAESSQIFDELCADPTVSEAVLLEKLSMLTQYALLENSNSRPGKAREKLAQAADFAKEISTDSVEAGRAVGLVGATAGQIEMFQGNYAEAVRHISGGVDLLGQVYKQTKRLTDATNVLSARIDLASSFFELARFEEAIAVCDQIEDQCNLLFTSDGATRKIRFNRAMAVAIKGRIAARVSDFATGKTHTSEAITQFELLAKDFPKILIYERELYRCFVDKSAMLISEEDLTPAEKMLVAAKEEIGNMDVCPAAWKSIMVQCHRLLAEVHIQRGDVSLGEDALNEAIGRQQEVCREYPDNEQEKRILKELQEQLLEFESSRIE